jgi:DNA-binding transcriptional LysR family regulator
MDRLRSPSMLNWDDLRFFLAVARHGSLSAAARVLKVSQPTVGRRISAFERALGTKLFVATRLGQELSTTGRDLMAHAERMELDVLAAERVTAARDLRMHGRVSVTATAWMIDGVLAPLVSAFSSQYPELELELMADVRHLNLVRREADIALRTSRFEHNDIVQRKVGVVAFGLYASDAYLARYGAPDFAGRCEGHRLIAMSASITRVADVEWLPPLAGKAQIAIRANGRGVMATLASDGIGMACLCRASWATPRRACACCVRRRQRRSARSGSACIATCTRFPAFAQPSVSWRMRLAASALRSTPDSNRRGERRPFVTFGPLDHHSGMSPDIRASEDGATRREWFGLTVIALPCLLYSMDLTVLNLAIPALSMELRPTGAELLWILDVYGFFVAGSLITSS